MPLDAEKYLHHLADFDLPHDRKVELIHSVGAMMESFVDRGFGVHPVQLIEAAARKRDSRAPADPVKSNDTKLNERFEAAAQQRRADKQDF